MRKILSSIFLILGLGIFSTEAQTIETFKNRLAQPVGAEAARVTATEHGDAARAVAADSKQVGRYRFRGYRVCIFFDNGQTARAEAVEAKSKFEENFPEIPVYMVYENPYFKVTVGNCLTSEEAIILKEHVSGLFPKAFFKKEELTAADLLR